MELDACDCREMLAQSSGNNGVVWTEILKYMFIYLVNCFRGQMPREKLSK